MTKKTLNLILICTMVAVFMMGCGKKVKPPEVGDAEERIEAEKPEPDIHDKEYSSIPELKTVNFNYDKFNISSKAGDILQENADFLKENPEYEVLVEGHCCECGTNEYNLGLGQKRAEAVRKYYMKLGVPGDSVGTISYGEEKPVNVNAGPPDSPRCTSNRRAETKARKKAE